MGSMITFQRPDGQAVGGYLAQAAGARASVVVIQEWWGLNDQIRGVADRLVFGADGAMQATEVRQLAQVKR
jgi:carboxymethylenebutenolidase